jgi:8-amino-7-oxononanoate synthase
MQNFPNTFKQRLQEREQNHSLRGLVVTLAPIDFSSNNYLGLAQSKALFEATHDFLEHKNIFKNGSTGSRLLSGNDALFEEVERFLADFHKSEAALLFNSGYDANIGLFSAIPRNAIILFDELVHASIRDGIRLSNAKAYKFEHNNLEDLEQKLLRFKSDDAEVFVVTESVFSMGGDSPDLKKLVKICKNHTAYLIIDEAHGIGVFGSEGEGLVQANGLEQDVFARVVTFGKALGVHGAAVVGSKDLKSYLVNFCRSFIYTTALSPHSVASIFMAYQFMKEAHKERELLMNNINHFNELFGIYDKSPIKSVVISGNEKVKKQAQKLIENGFDVRPILSPTVPEGQERLRFCLHSYNTPEQIRKVYELLYE